MATDAPEITMQDVSGLSRRLREPEWLAAWRARAFEIYQETPLPIRAQHLWRYTDPALFEPDDTLLARTVGAPVPAAGDEAASHGVPAEGLTAKESAGPGTTVVTSGADLKASGITLTDFTTAARDHEDALRSLLGRIVGPDTGKFEALNAAIFREGIYLHIPRGVAVRVPIHLVTRLGDRPLQARRLLVHVEEGASATLIEEVVGGPESGVGGRSRHYGVTELQLESGSQLHFVTVQSLSRHTEAHFTQLARLLNGASYVPVLASFGGALTKTNVGATLEGDGSTSEMIGFLSAVGRQRFDHHTLHHHLGRHTRSNLDYKTVLQDRSRSDYTGLIRIEKEAAFAEAYQENRNLLLSERCRADSIPELEILTEEVQCKHGATAGPIDPDHLFYLMSRALPEAEAVRLIVEGHFEPTLLRLPPELRERLGLLLRSRLESETHKGDGR